ncbi:hypothetical protein HDV00_005590 [Rhizophlyctis rosea]|nr:hypothetical protein HDV00_005590 [Rhizophlyctis rosea]
MPRRPPGGQSSIVFGDEPVTYVTTAASPPAQKQRTASPSRKAPGAISQIFGNNDAPSTPPSTPPKRPFGGLKNQSSLVLGDDSPSGGDAVAPVTERLAQVSVDAADAAPAGYQPKAIEKRPTRPPGGKTSVALAWDESAQPVPSPSPKKKVFSNTKPEERPSRPGRRLYGDPGHQSQIQLGGPERPAAAAPVPTPPRTPSPVRASAARPAPSADQSRTTYEQPVNIPTNNVEVAKEEEAVETSEPEDVRESQTSGRTRPASWAPIPRTASSSSLKEETPSSPPRSARKYSHFRSSVVFGDDSPHPPDFSPRKVKPGKKLLPTPGAGSGVSSIVDLAGGSSGDASAAAPASASASSPRAVKTKIDPATLSVAGSTTGKHRVY